MSFPTASIPEYGKRDAYKMAWAVIDEAIRNAVAVGADPERIAILDNFCWGDPLRPETLGSLVEACRGCHDAALFYGTPFISGKDSLNNEYLGTDGQRHAIPPTLLISAIGMIEDVNQAVTMDLKEAGNVVYLIGDFTVFGGSHFQLLACTNESCPMSMTSRPRSTQRCIKPSQTVSVALRTISAKAGWRLPRRKCASADAWAWNSRQLKNPHPCSIWRSQRLPAGGSFASG